MYRFAPSQIKSTAMLLSLSCAAAGLVIAVLSSRIGHRFLLLIIASAILILLGIWFLYRFALLSYRYELTRDVFRVVRCLFGRERTVFSVRLALCCAALPLSDKTARRRIGIPRRYCNFCCAWPTESPVVLYYRVGEGLYAAVLDGNDAFFSLAARDFRDPEQL